jgi:hypothetical protein
MSELVFLDTETCGLTGPAVLLQYDEGHGVELYDLWLNPIRETLELIERLTTKTVVGFNLAFDWFQLQKIYTMFLLHDPDWIPADHIDDIAEREAEARDGPCIKPVGCCDIMLHAKKGPYQTLMDREDVIIKRVPTALAWMLAAELDKRLELKDVYFARKSDPKRRWVVRDIHDDLGNLNPDLKNLVLEFAPSSALKALAQDALGLEAENVLIFKQTEPPPPPEELGYAPFCTALGKRGDWRGTWPNIIRAHISHWAFNKVARRYAADDVIYTSKLYEHFGSPPPNDDDSILACMVGSVRWKGLAIDVEALKSLRDTAVKHLSSTEWNFNSPDVCVRYLESALSPTERVVMLKDGRLSTGKIILESIAKWRQETVCDKCLGAGCPECEDGLIKSDEPHQAAERAQAIIDYRKASKEIELYDKLLAAGRFHVSLKVIGALSGRMSGADGLNPQGINHAKKVRACFPLAWPGMQLGGGDFDGFEVTIADAVYQDLALRQDLLLGKKIHALFGTCLFAPMTYEEILATAKLEGDKNKYSRSKNGVFAMLYGGEAATLVSRVGVTEAAANEAYQRWIGKYKQWGEARRKTFDKFCSMRQPNGLGSKVEWHSPADYCESLFGFKRYFTLENRICKILFDLAEDPPKEWLKVKVKVVRRDREQTACGATRSALFGSAFRIQAGNMRAAANHEIQSTGAQATKRVQVAVWAHQPVGVSSWRVIPMNVHDEIMCPCSPDVVDAVHGTVNREVECLRKHIPLIKMEWMQNLKTWAEK